MVEEPELGGSSTDHGEHRLVTPSPGGTLGERVTISAGFLQLLSSVL